MWSSARKKRQRLTHTMWFPYTSRFFFFFLVHLFIWGCSAHYHALLTSPGGSLVFCLLSMLTFRNMAHDVPWLFFYPRIYPLPGINHSDIWIDWQIYQFIAFSHNQNEQNVVRLGLAALHCILYIVYCILHDIIDSISCDTFQYSNQCYKQKMGTQVRAFFFFFFNHSWNESNLAGLAIISKIIGD